MTKTRKYEMCQIVKNTVEKNKKLSQRDRVAWRGLWEHWAEKVISDRGSFEQRLERKRGENRVDRWHEFQAGGGNSKSGRHEVRLCSAHLKKGIQRQWRLSEGRLAGDEVRDVRGDGTVSPLSGHCTDSAFCSKDVGRLCWTPSRATLSSLSFKERVCCVENGMNGVKVEAGTFGKPLP